jgi:cbb3-type cytochrome oxidase subunit 3
MKKNSKISLENHDTIYDVSNWMIFKKNLLAGFARSIGSWFFNIIFLALLVYILIPLFGPAVKQMFDSLPKDLNEIIIQIEKK